MPFCFSTCVQSSGSSLILWRTSCPIDLLAEVLVFVASDMLSTTGASVHPLLKYGFQKMSVGVARSCNNKEIVRGDFCTLLSCNSFTKLKASGPIPLRVIIFLHRVRIIARFFVLLPASKNIKPKGSNESD